MSLSNTDDFNYMIIILIVVQYTRLFQVVLQSALLLIGSKLKAATPEMKMMKPGKQVINYHYSLSHSFLQIFGIYYTKIKDILVNSEAVLN